MVFLDISEIRRRMRKGGGCEGRREEEERRKTNGGWENLFPWTTSSFASCRLQLLRVPSIWISGLRGRLQMEAD